MTKRNRRLFIGNCCCAFHDSCLTDCAEWKECYDEFAGAIRESAKRPTRPSIISRVKGLFAKKPIVVKPPETLDIFSEDQCKLDDAVNVITSLCQEYGPDGMEALTKEVWRQVGNRIFNRGMRRWKI